MSGRSTHCIGGQPLERSAVDYHIELFRRFALCEIVLCDRKCPLDTGIVFLEGCDSNLLLEPNGQSRKIRGEHSAAVYRISERITIHSATREPDSSPFFTRKGQETRDD